LGHRYCKRKRGQDCNSRRKLAPPGSSR
jgi:hypothetical protein